MNIAAIAPSVVFVMLIVFHSSFRPIGLRASEDLTSGEHVRTTYKGADQQLLDWWLEQ